MASTNLCVLETVIAFSCLVVAAYFLKQASVLREEHSALFAGLLTQAILPATIFYQLATHSLSGGTLLPVVVMCMTSGAALVLSWMIGRALGLSKPDIGALIIVSSFGSSALMGYPMLEYAFPHNPGALAEGIIISELGVGLPIFILCPAVAMYFSGTFQGRPAFHKLARDYFRSPIFIAVILGLVFSKLALPDKGVLLGTIFETLRMVQGSLVVVSALILGLQLSLRPVRGFMALIVISLAIQVFFQPWLSGFMAHSFRLSAENRQVLVLISAMPAAILGPVFATRYGCAAKTATVLTFTHIVTSPVLLPMVFALIAE